MRKKQPAGRRLLLHRQTLRALTGAELAGLVGGGKPVIQTGLPKSNVWTADDGDTWEVTAYCELRV